MSFWKRLLGGADGRPARVGIAAQQVSPAASTRPASTPGVPSDQAIIDAAKTGDATGVQKLLRLGANVNARETDGYTPLMWASSRGHLEVVQVLLASGADINAKDKDGYNALMKASLRERPRVMEALLAKGADVNAQIKGGQTTGGTALTMCGGQYELVHILLEKGADVNATDNHGATVLILAATAGEYDSVRELLSRGADATVKSKWGTALECATEKGHAKIITLLTNPDDKQHAAPQPSIVPTNLEASSTAIQTTVAGATALPPGSTGGHRFEDKKWGFSVSCPDNWIVAAEEHVEGEWHKPVVFAREQDGDRIAVSIFSIGAMHQGGTVADYMQKAQMDLSSSFPEFSLISREEKLVNNLTTAWMRYRYLERGKRNEEYNVTFFLGKNRGVPFQIVCFTEAQRLAGLEREFAAIIQSLSFPKGRLWLPHISLYGSSPMKCDTCGTSIRPDAAVPFIRLPENEMRVMCGGCRKATQ